MMNTDAKKAKLTELENEALRWHIRLHSGAATENDWMAFTRWLEADPAHNTAYDTIALAWDIVGEISPEPNNAEQTQPADNILAFPLHRLRKAVSTRPLAFGGGFGAAIAATLLILMAPVFINDDNTLGGIAYHTGIGEQHTVTLADGSTIMLNTNTALTVTVDKNTRHVAMQKGEAFYTIHHDRARPFTVAVNDVRITDVGTRFNIRAEPTRTLVSVTEGIVDIAPKNAPDVSQRLIAGTQAVHQTGQVIAVKAFDAEQVSAWQQGQLVFNNDDLVTVVAELNRYFSKPVQLVGADLGTMKFSGVLQLDNQQRALRDLTAFLPLTATETGNSISLFRNIKTNSH